MTKLAIIAQVAGLIFARPGPCAAFENLLPRTGDLAGLVRELNIADAAVEPGTPSAAEWTIMVYINAKNNLEHFGLADINEMEAVGSSDKVNIVVEFGRMAVYDDGDGGWSGVRRYLIRKDTDTAAITSPAVGQFRADMGDWKHLAEFGKWARTEYPAKKYMLIVWNHGSGWEKTAARPASKGISYDDETGNHITTPQLAAALEEMGKLDVYASDACLMQMAEVLYELKDRADYVVGSEETEPGAGYPYDLFLGALARNQFLTPEELSVALVDAYRRYYSQTSGAAATISVVRTAALAGFLPLINNWVDLVIASGEKNAVNAAVRGALYFDAIDNKDLFDFVRLLVLETKSPGVAAGGKELLDFISRELVVAQGVSNENYAASHGVAVFLPVYHYNDDYDALQWAVRSKWDEFIQWYPR